MHIGRLICLEGIEGSGKTTHAEFILRYLQSINQTAISTREPGGTPIAEAIRGLLLQNQNSARDQDQTTNSGARQHFAEGVQEALTPEAELLLMFAARSQHITHRIRPALQAGHWVICDRFTEASYAYQGGGRKLTGAFIHCLETYVQHDLKINRVILLDIPVSLALSRIHTRRMKIPQYYDRIEAETEVFFTRVRAAYLSRAKQYPELYCIIDANAPLEQVQQQITQVLQELLIA